MSTCPQTRPDRARGFTLIELVVAMLVAALLATLALSSYSSQVRKGRRVEAKTALLDLAGREERELSATNAYSTVAANLGYAGVFPVVVGSGYYQVSVAVPDPNNIPAAGQPPTFLLTATPLGTQLQDTQCQTFTVNSQGTQKALDNGGADNTANCW
ncbi:MAG TPA: type IV pilin protein [Steroidobacteraceae bacterium]|nr:type IV pilin protein [Steroidobacteraceae bacterium]